MKTVIELTREAGGFDATPKFLERFAELVRADEREACSMLAWSAVLSMTDSDTADKVLAAIRARSNT